MAHRYLMGAALSFLFLVCAVFVAAEANASERAASKREDSLVADVIKRRATTAKLALAIWDLAEVCYQETRSSVLLQRYLTDAGFDVETGVAGMPTSFVASYGEGQPVIGILAEFDALPGISQTAVPERNLREDRASGHACGHHLFGAGSVSAAIAVKHWLQDNPRTGTIRVYGTPAEEGGSGKVYMVRAGLFDDVDVALHWHPADRNAANPATSLANKSARFRFRGISSHAAAAPHRGRSALDGVEAMNYMANLLREHVPESTRIHYVITRGGEAPNVVPDDAEVYYYVRHPKATTLETIWVRLMKIAQAAALGTGTQVQAEVMHGNHSLLPNETLARIMHRNLTSVGGVTWNDAERRFAEKLATSFIDPAPNLEGAEAMVQPMKLVNGRGSTDVGDVSWVVPTAGLRAATWVPGTSAHSWQAVAAGGTEIGIKGMQVAAKVLAMTARDLLANSAVINRAEEEFHRRRGAGFKYEALLGDRDPPLDYRR